jgi:energy-coupling factor transporter transmembrane protein EcfT
MKKINPIIALIYLIILIIITVYMNFNNIPLVLILALIIGLIMKLKFKTIFKYLTLGLFLSIFIFIINYNFNHQIILSLQLSAVLLVKFLMFIIFSLTFKNYYTNRDIAYAVSNILSCIGINKAYIYTNIMLILNQIYNMKTDIEQMYQIQVKDKKIKNTIKLIIPFIKMSNLKTDQITMSLILKGYNQQQNIKLYHNYQTTYKNYITMLLLLITYTLIIFGR